MTRNCLLAAMLLLSACTSRSGYKFIADDEVDGAWSVDVDVGPWEPVGDSAPGPHTVRTAYGSASGGGLSNTLGSVNSVAVVLDGAGVPIVVFNTTSTNGELSLVARTWGTDEALPLPATPPQASVLGATAAFRTAALALGTDGVPMVAWYSAIDFFTGSLYVHRLDGTTWTELGPGSGSGAGLAPLDGQTPIALFLDAGGAPVVSWRNPQLEVCVLRFNGSAWVEMGSGSAGAVGISDSGGAVSGGISSAGRVGLNPAIAWSDDRSGSDRVYLRQWDGTTWAELGGSGTGNVIGTSSLRDVTPTVALTDAGYPVVAWAHGQPGTYYQIYARAWNGSAWVDKGAASASGGGLSSTAIGSAGPALAATGNDTFLLTWLVSDPYSAGNSTALYAKRWNGSAWVEAGPGSASGSGFASAATRYGPRLDGRLDGTAFAVWTDDWGPTSQVYGMAFDGTDWRELGSSPALGDGINAAGDHAYLPSLGFNGAGHPALAWENASDDGVAEPGIYVRRFDGTDWLDWPAGLTSGVGIGGAFENHGPRLAFGGADRAFVAFHFGYPIGLRAWDGAAWTDYPAGSTSGIGLLLNGGSDAHGVTIATDSRGEPWLAWHDDCANSGFNVFVQRFNGSAWEGVGPEICVSDGVSDMNYGGSSAIAIDPDDQVYVAWSGRDGPSGEPHQVYVRRWDGSAWRAVGAHSDAGLGVSGASRAVRPTLALDAEQQPWLAWSETVGEQSEICLRRFDGTAWVDVDGSSTNGCVSRTPGASLNPKIAFADSGAVVVGWLDDSSGPAQVYVRGYDPVRGWHELSGSAHAAGVSNSSAPATSMDLAVAGNRACVAWSQPGVDAAKIYIRCSLVSD